ncbi:MAG: hypothetical protein JEZ07_09710 [Phycisphaerae bacterium]|nr:hypothetical protein [Phycisphaerae bacterium]
MAILVGIDEAGYGPILGPLVVSACIFELPDSILKTPLWDILSHSVCKTRTGAKGRIAINDSKKLHSKFGDVKHLQRGVLAALTCLDKKTPSNFMQLMQSLDGWDATIFAQYPWYRTAANNWELEIGLGDLAVAVGNLRKDLQANNLAIKDFWSLPLAAGHYNHLIDLTDNKAKVLFQQAAQLIFKAWSKYGSDNNLQIVCDRQGGRSHYRVPLQRILPDATFKIIKESPTVSSYQLTENKRSMKIHFIVKGDSEQLPVALASMASKYVRELMMLMLNKYFNGYFPDLKPTAGYYQDGTRFINELIANKIEKSLMPKDLLIRKR